MSIKSQIAKITRSAERTALLQKASEIAHGLDPYAICDFAEMLPGPFNQDKEITGVLEDAILRYSEKNKDPYHAYEYAFCMADNGVRITLDEFEKNVIRSGNVKLIDYFKDFVNGANKRDLAAAKQIIEQELASTGRLPKSLRYIGENEKGLVSGDMNYWTISMKSPDDIAKLAINGKSAYTMTEAAEHLSNPDMFENIKAKTLYNLRRVPYPYYYTKFDGQRCPSEFSAKEVNVLELWEEVKKTGDILNGYEFGCSVPSVLDKHTAGIVVNEAADWIASGDQPKLMYYAIAYTDWNKDEQMLEALGSKSKTDKRFARYLGKANDFIAGRAKEGAAAHGHGG
ncbi:MAG: hypothetical protein FWE53_00195 [Firmicutes bacterium]|nr:hypothetical protein [Bacillota bacterium]